MSVPTALTIGHFDGVHRGHVQLVATARRAVGADGRVLALSFDPHPLTVLKPGRAPARLTTFDQRRERLTEAGADEIVKISADREFLSQSAPDFIRWLADFYCPSVIVEGPDFHFGRGRAGSVQTLRDHEAEYGYRTIVVDPVTVTLDDLTIVRASSSITRWLLNHGRVHDAKCILDRPYELIGTVVRGEQRGRSIGVPTANLDAGDLLLPADGIYAGFATDPEGARWPAAISIGVKPTFGDGHPRVCEAHLLDYDGPLDAYEWAMRLDFRHWLRDQLAFHSVQSLTDQLHRDIDHTRRLIDQTEMAVR